MDLKTKTSAELASMLQETKDLVEDLVQSASEKFKESEKAGWDKQIYEEAQSLLTRIETLQQETEPVVEELECRLDPDTLEALRKGLTPQPIELDQRLHRSDLTTETVPITGTGDGILPLALDNLISRLPRTWWREQRVLSNEQHKKAALQPLLLCGRVRWGADFTILHKYAYYLSLVDGLLNEAPYQDIYSAARAVPEICQLGSSLEALQEVEGAKRKLRELWRSPSEETDARIFELLVAAAFARMGHKVAFVETSSEKTPDLRLYGHGIPIVIECKRKQVLNSYEQHEFSIVRELFAILSTERVKLGLMGELTIDFREELVNLHAGGIAQDIRDMTKSLSPYGAQQTEWGTIGLKPVDTLSEFEPTPLYSPKYLEEVFGINLESDDFDGICVVARNDSSPIVGFAELPLLMKWSSNSKAAIKRKLQTVKSLWLEAVNQIPTGESGFIYLAYEEGHRPQLADERTDTLCDLATNIYFKRRAITVPMTIISRLIPNIISGGSPDLIENAILLVEGDRDNHAFFTSKFPTRVFTP